MENKLQLFENEEFGRLEVLLIDSKPYFPATECAKVLGYSNAPDAVRRHCRWCVKHAVPHPQSPDKRIEVGYIPEGDLYRLIIRSKLPAAERFEKWVFDEVLPSIRQHGAYISPDALKKMLDSKDFTDTLLQALSDEQGEHHTVTQRLLEEQAYSSKLEQRLAEAEPKASYYDLILQCPGTVQVSLIAKDYGMSAAMFNRLLHGLGIQYKVGNTWLLYQRYAGMGYTRSRTYYISEYSAVVHTYWTQKGRIFLYETLKRFGIVPLAEAMEYSRVDAMNGRR